MLIGNGLFCFISHQEVEKVQFSENVDTYDENMTFQDINVSRPLMKVSIVYVSLRGLWK